MKVAEIIEWLQALPPGSEGRFTFELTKAKAGASSSAERMRALRARRKGKSDGSDASLVTEGGWGESVHGSEKEAEKQGKETGSGSNLKGGSSANVTKVTRHMRHTKEEREAVEFVFNAWKLDTGHERAFLDRKRGNRILARLREGKTKEDLVLAITNRRKDPFLMGTAKGSEGKVYDGIETLLRDAGQVERLMALGGPAPSGPEPTDEERERWRRRREELDRMEAANAPH